MNDAKHIVAVCCISQHHSQTPIRRWKNFAIFDWNRRLSRKRYKIGSCSLGNVSRKSSMTHRVVSDDTEWLWKAWREEFFFRWISLITLIPFDIEQQNSVGNTYGERCISRGLPMPLPQGCWAQVFPFLGVPFQIWRVGACGHRRWHVRGGAGSQRSTIGGGGSFYLCVHPLSQKYQIWGGNTRIDGACILESATPPIPSERSFSAPQF